MTLLCLPSVKGLIWILAATRWWLGQGLRTPCIFTLTMRGKMSISQMRKQRLNIWSVCAAAGPEGNSNREATFFHILSILDWWCGKIALEHQESIYPGRGVLQGRGLLKQKLLVGEGLAGRWLSSAEAWVGGGKGYGVCRELGIVQGC